MSILVLDLGTRTGWAWGDGRGTILSGVWDFNTKRFASPGRRYQLFGNELRFALTKMQPSTVFFEEVRRHLGTNAAHIYGGFLAQLQMICDAEGVEYESVPVGEIKRSWCGAGNASKDEMMNEARRRGFNPVTDDEADALAILHLKLKGDLK